MKCCFCSESYEGKPGNGACVVCIAQDQQSAIEALQADGIEVDAAMEYWLDQYRKFQDGMRGPEMHDQALSTFSRLG